MFRICNNSCCITSLQALGCLSPAYVLPARKAQLFLVWGLRWGHQAGATEKRHQRKLRHHRYTLFLRALHANFSWSGSVHRVLFLWKMCTFQKTVWLSHSLVGPPWAQEAVPPAQSQPLGAWTQETALSTSACWTPLCGLGGQHPSLAARSLGAWPGMHML